MNTAASIQLVACDHTNDPEAVWTIGTSNHSNFSDIPPMTTGGWVPDYQPDPVPPHIHYHFPVVYPSIVYQQPTERRESERSILEILGIATIVFVYLLAVAIVLTR